MSRINCSGWWIVMVPGEYAETSDLFGPYRSDRLANDARDRWNAAHPGAPATVIPLLKMPSTLDGTE